MSSLDATPRVSRAVALLRSQQERVTKARIAVLQVLDQSAGHLNADEIVRHSEALAPGVHRATVYRALATLGDLGLVTHTHIAGSATVYHLEVPAPDDHPHPHAHLQCTHCGTVLDVAAEALQPLVVQVRRDLGFRLEPEHAALLGTCAGCQQPAGADEVLRTP